MMIPVLGKRYVDRLPSSLVLAAIAAILQGCGVMQSLAPKVETPDDYTAPQRIESSTLIAAPREPTVASAAPSRTSPPTTPITPVAPRTKPSPSARDGRYFQNDGPGAIPPSALADLRDAEPRDEPLADHANRPYVAMGKTYSPGRSRKPLRQRGVASWYGRQFHGRKTATGERYDMYAMSAAHPTLPLPSYLRVTNLANRRSVIVRVNDRGPFLAGRVLDVSYAAAAKLGFVDQGATLVELEAILTVASGEPPRLASR